MRVQETPTMVCQQEAGDWGRETGVFSRRVHAVE